ncbi:MAG: fibronectin type III domain-containing protein [Spirochaetota bacterium]
MRKKNLRPLNAPLASSRRVAARLMAVVVLVATALVPGATTVGAAERTIELGGDDRWQRLALTERLVSRPGRQGYLDLSLEPFRFEADASTELLLSFDELPLRDAAGNYRVAPAQGQAAPELTRAAQRTGSGALLVDGVEDRLLLEPLRGSVFQPGTEWGSFTLEFWLYPVALPDASVVFSWRAREGVERQFRSQEFSVYADRGALVARFANFFIRPDGSGTDITLRASERLIPRAWSHHMIRFDADTALLEYFVDGQPADLTYVSRTGRQDGSVYFPRIASFPGEGLTVADGVVGVLDELRIARRLVHETERPELPPSGGQLVSDYIDLGPSGATLRRIGLTSDTPGLSDVFLYYRLVELRGRDPLAGDEWTPVRPDEPIPAARGRFLQLRAELLPDTRESLAPTLSRITVTYEPAPPPLPPTAVRAVPRDGAVVLEWAPVQGAEVAGYRVYYGDQSGRYFGSGSERGASPIDVGPATAVTITGLENGTLYFFAVQAYTDAERDADRQHELSTEVAARPARVYR